MSGPQEVALMLREAGIRASPSASCLMTLVNAHLLPLEARLKLGTTPQDHPLAEYARALRTISEVLAHHQALAITEFRLAIEEAHQHP